MKKNIFKLIAFVITLGLFSFSCDKTNIDKPQVDLATSQDNILSEKAVSGVFDVVNSLPGLKSAQATSDCATYSWNQKLLTITYPQAGCIGNDGNTRSGVIKAQFNSGFSGIWAVNDNVTITFENYYVNGNKLTGIILATCAAIQPKKIFHLTSDNMVLTFTDTKTVSWNTNVYYTMLEGSGTATWTDDVWQIDGSHNGTGRNGKTFSRVATALTTSTTCKYFVSGNLAVTVNSTDTYDIAFQSTCGSIIITYKEIPFPITL
jgi:hypothetical protein